MDEGTEMPFVEVGRFEKISSLSDDESYAEYMKLSPKEQIEYDTYMRQKAEHYKELCFQEEAKVREMEKRIIEQEKEYKRLKDLQ